MINSRVKTRNGKNNGGEMSNNRQSATCRVAWTDWALWRSPRFWGGGTRSRKTSAEPGRSLGCFETSTSWELSVQPARLESGRTLDAISRKPARWADWRRILTGSDFSQNRDHSG